jgi:hypothetical protein
MLLSPIMTGVRCVFRLRRKCIRMVHPNSIRLHSSMLLAQGCTLRLGCVAARALTFLQFFRPRSVSHGVVRACTREKRRSDVVIPIGIRDRDV